MITPAFGPVEGATPEVAAANMNSFLDDVREHAALNGEVRGYTPQTGEPVRRESLDADGRYGWAVEVNGKEVEVLMPGVEESLLRGLADTVPALRVNDEWAWWSGAVQSAVPLPG
ncbi:hypothetical protein [Actinoplanes aureus]|uniref:Uncharacterized protein n=1 Tax=Actinoplanes aureus TaxID=2792083 RepID=A0A931CFP1_9ACTN|nr:hypothetical protein [Actinoplanes aureus]MBG0569157.1 hypothetical protein [Actinoplanes aureus]MBG0569274.1 hypothetical protein [Actinoplanes aureus]